MAFSEVLDVICLCSCFGLDLTWNRSQTLPSIFFSDFCLYFFNLNGHTGPA